MRTIEGRCANRGQLQQTAVFLIVGIATMVLPIAAKSQYCLGDCDRDGRVTANEISSVLQSGCSVAPPDLDVVNPARVGEAVSNAFDDCEGLPEDWQVAYDASELGYMMSGWGTGDGSVWVVGGQLERGAILRFADGEWNEVDPGIEVPLLNWVHGTSDQDVFMGGTRGTILHFDGAEWVQQATPVGAAVWGLWAVAPDDVWAVGGEGAFGALPFVMRYDGEVWTEVAVPPLVRPGVSAFFKVWGSSADNIYIVGQNGAVVRWDGVELIETGVGISQDLIGIWGNGPDDITVAGGRGTAELAHFDGVEWSRLPPSSIVGLNGVWTRRPDLVHSVGVLGTALRVDPRGPEVLAQDFVPSTLELHAVFGDDSDQLLAFGANFNVPESGVVLIRELADDE